MRMYTMKLTSTAKKGTILISVGIKGKPKKVKG